MQVHMVGWEQRAKEKLLFGVCFQDVKSAACVSGDDTGVRKVLMVQNEVTIP